MSQEDPSILAVYEESIETLKNQVLQLQATRHMEAPASANFRMVSQTGIELQFTLRSNVEEDLINRLSEFIPKLTAMHFIPIGKSSAPVSSTLSSGLSTTTHQVEKTVTTLHVAKIDVMPKGEGKSTIQLTCEGRQYPDLTNTQSIDRLVQIFAPIGLSATHFSAPGSYPISAEVDFVLSDKLANNGRPFKNIISVRAQ